jgi:hypothetical protein
MKGESLEVSLQLSAKPDHRRDRRERRTKQENQKKLPNVCSAFSAGSAVEDFADG